MFTHRVSKPLAAQRTGRPPQNHKTGVLPHRFRSTFPDWAAEQTTHTREVIESALVWVVQNMSNRPTYSRTSLTAAVG